jgi:two-component system chemotaxis sensor kinase CheA
MSNNAALDEGRQVFVEESRDLLHQMEDALLRLETNPGDEEAINSLFRAAHTIKGSAGLFAYDGIVRFTHVVESVLDRVRGNELALSPAIMSLLLPACDHIGVLLEQLSAEEDAPVDPAIAATGAKLVDGLNALLGAPPMPAAAPAAPRPAAAADSLPSAADGVASDAWHLSLRFGRDVLRNGMDPLSFIRYLRTIGEIVHLTTITDALPAAESFDPESCYLGFEIRLKSAATKKVIEDVFEFVREDCTLHILPPHSRALAYAELIDLLPEDNDRIGEILVACGALTANELDAALLLQQQSATPAKLGDILVESHSVRRDVVDAALDKQQKIQGKRSEESRYIRVNAEKLDHLITLVGELVIAGAGAHLLAGRGTDSALHEATSGLNDLTEEIRDCALRLRMVQIGETFNRFHRIVRDVSREIGKDIVLDVTGGDAELDKSVVEKINDPLTHLVRNSVDHGIESAEIRRQHGKPERGQVRLNAFHDSGSIVIEVSDDGRGLDRERILAKGRERGLVAPDATPSEQDIFNLVFEPGFSTAEKVTNLSGRGVGMDVVRRNIEALRGTVSLSSRLGEGTTVTIRLPLTLAIIDGFLVQVGNSVFVLPLDMVVECVELPADRPRGGNYINLRNQVLPYLTLRELFELNGERPSRESVVVVNFAGRKAGIVVDRLLGEMQTVIKPLGSMFSALQGISGSSILGTGEVALILDVPALVSRAAEVCATATASASASAVKPADGVH